MVSEFRRTQELSEGKSACQIETFQNLQVPA